MYYFFYYSIFYHNYISLIENINNSVLVSKNDITKNVLLNL